MKVNSLTASISIVIAAASACGEPGPVDCHDPKLATSFDRGVAWSQDLTSRAQAHAAGETAAMEDEGSARCLLAGVSAGLRNVRGVHWFGAACCGDGAEQRDGRALGEVAAALYCDLSIALGGLGADELLEAGPADSCSRAFETACRSAFDRAARSQPGCAQFTRAEFRQAYEVARFNQCVFSVAGEQPPAACADERCHARCQGKFDRCGHGSHACALGCRR